MKKIFKDILIILLLNIALAAIVWLPFYFRLNIFGLDFSGGLEAIYRNFDGLEYVVISKSLYDPLLIVKYPMNLSAGYFAAHFPGYAMFILPLAILMGYLKSMLLTSLIFTILSTIAFYWMIKDLKLTEHPLFLSAVFLILPARWLIVHSVGSAEPVFIFFTILAFYFFMKFENTNKMIFIWLTAIAGMFAQFTRPPGILIFVAIIFYLIWRIITNRTNYLSKLASYLPLFLIPASLFLVFYWYSISYNDFFAYFHSGDNIHLTFPPYQVFNVNQFWVGSIWLEDIIYIIILGYLGGLYLIKQKLYPLAFFVLTYLTASIFVAHRDVSRYVLPVFPFVLIAFEKVLVSKEFKIVLAIAFLAIYLYAENFLIANVAPIANLQIFN